MSGIPSLFLYSFLSLSLFFSVFLRVVLVVSLCFALDLYPVEVM